MIDSNRFRRNIVFFMLVCAGCISYVDRTALAIANVNIIDDFKISYSNLGIVLSSFAWVYMLSQIPAGLLADKFGSRWILFYSFLMWSLAQFISGISSNIWYILLGRCILGFGEAPIFLAGTRVIARLFHEDERAVPIGLFNSSASLGQIIAPALLSIIVLKWGWHAMFLSLSAVSVIFGGLWLCFYKENTKEQIIKSIPSSRSSAIQELRFLLLRPSTWVLASGSFGIIYLRWFYAAWLPTYFQSELHYTVEKAGYLSSIPQIFGFIGGISGGVLVDRLARGKYTPLQSCYYPLICSLISGSFFTIISPFCGNIILSVILMSIALFSISVAITSGWTLAIAVADTGSVATLEAIQNVGGSLGGAMAPLISGVVIQSTGSFVYAMLISGLIGGISVIIYMVGLGNSMTDPQ
ncbi:putative major facilitator superfamily transporter [Komagataeibacter xylinus E25]|nr:putative major facilitator superfamily transporter [Komagataeibacter xylinus E25]